MDIIPQHPPRMADVTTNESVPYRTAREEIKEYLMEWLTSANDIELFEKVYAEVLEDLLVELVNEAKHVESIRQRVSSSRPMS